MAARQRAPCSKNVLFVLIIEYYRIFETDSERGSSGLHFKLTIGVYIDVTRFITQI